MKKLRGHWATRLNENGMVLASTSIETIIHFSRLCTENQGKCKPCIMRGKHNNDQ